MRSTAVIALMAMELASQAAAQSLVQTIEAENPPALRELTLDDYVRGAMNSDSDSDGLSNHDDNCPAIADSKQSDAIGDGVGDECDPCPDNPAQCIEVEIPYQLLELTEEQYIRAAKASDSDSDGLSNYDDNCGTLFNPEQKDSDSDGVGDMCDLCPENPAPGLIDGCPETQ